MFQIMESMQTYNYCLPVACFKINQYLALNTNIIPSMKLVQHIFQYHSNNTLYSLSMLRGPMSSCTHSPLLMDSPKFIHNNYILKRSSAKYQFSTGNNNLREEQYSHPYHPLITNYLCPTSKQLKETVFSKSPTTRIAVPRTFTTPSQKNNHKFEAEWANKSAVFLIDNSALIGSKRQFARLALEQNVYKGVSDAPDILSRVNPMIQLDLEQCQLDMDLLIYSDPSLASSSGLSQSDDDQRQMLIDLYEKDPQRLSNRLKQELNVPSQYTKLIELSIINNNAVYFVGLNEFVFRFLLADFLSLSDIRDLFMESLKYSTVKIIEENGQSANEAGNLMHKFSRQYIYLQHYGLLQKLQNGYILNMLRCIENQYIVFGPSYTIQSLTQQSSILKQWDISSSDKSTDPQKVQKHAILEVMLGRLWQRASTVNKFPYLSEQFGKLSSDDKKTVHQMYDDCLVKYTSAKKLFIAKNLRQGNV